MATASTAAPSPPAAPPARRGRLPLIVGLVLAVLGGAGGFYAVRAGLLDRSAEEPKPAADLHLPAASPMAFVPLTPLVVNIPGAGERRFLRFAGQVEVAPEHLEAVTALIPRIVDVLNGYLRAVEPSDLEDPAALTILRSQMLRRVQVVAGGDRIRDLLIMEFVIN